MNKVMLNGRICHDLELKEAGENKYSRFSVAVNRKFTKEDGTRDADFISCVAWNKTAEIINQYFKKGSLIGLVGRLQTGSYEKQDGSKGYTTDVIIEEFDFLEKKSEGRPAPEYTEAPKTQEEALDMVLKQDDPWKEFSNEVELDDSQLPF